MLWGIAVLVPECMEVGWAVLWRWKRLVARHWRVDLPDPATPSVLALVVQVLECVSMLLRDHLGAPMYRLSLVFHGVIEGKILCIGGGGWMQGVERRGFGRGELLHLGALG